MKWLKLDNYCLKSGEYFIAKYYLADGGIKYGLSHFNTNHGYFDSADEAKNKALRVVLGEKNDLWLP